MSDVVSPTVKQEPSFSRVGNDAEVQVAVKGGAIVVTSPGTRFYASYRKTALLDDCHEHMRRSQRSN
jgi:hypothetical protein